jgi:hypothetical protein
MRLDLARRKHSNLCHRKVIVGCYLEEKRKIKNQILAYPNSFLYALCTKYTITSIILYTFGAQLNEVSQMNKYSYTVSSM